MDVEESTATHTTVEKQCEQRDPTCLNNMWVGGPEAEGAMEMRTEIISRPSEGSHRPRIDPARDNRGQVALFRGKQITELHFDQHDLEDIEALRGCSMEYAHIPGSRYPPLGYDVHDILTLYAYKPEVTPVLRHNRLGARILVFKVLDQAREIHELQHQYSYLHDPVQQLNLGIATEDKVKEMMDKRDAAWYEQQEQSGSEISEYQEEQPRDSALQQVPHEQPSQHWNPHALDMHPSGAENMQMDAPAQQEMLPHHNPDPSPPPSGSMHLAQNVGQA